MNNRPWWLLSVISVIAIILSILSIAMQCE